MFKLLLIYIILLSSSAMTFAQELSSVTRVMSFNIRYGTAKDGDNHWDLRKEFLIATIAAFDPDLLGTQETLGFQRDYIAEHLPNYKSVGVGRVDGKLNGEMAALFFKKDRYTKLEEGHFWLSESPQIPGSVSWDSSLTRMVTWVRLKDLKSSGNNVIFFNTHFDHIGVTARNESARLLRNQIESLRGSDHVIVTGDFNAGERSDPYQSLFSDIAGQPSPIVDSYRSAHPKPMAKEGTFTDFKPENTTGARIDWIGVSPSFTIDSAGIDRTQKDGHTPSDHFPVTAVLKAYPY